MSDILPRVMKSATFIGTILLALISFFQWQARYDRREKDLLSLLGNRNLAYIAERYVKATMDDATENKWPSEIDLAFDTTKLAMNSIKYSEITPSPFVQEFIDLWNMTQRARQIVSDKSADRSLINHVRENAELHMNRIDRCLESTGRVSLNKEKFYIRNDGFIEFLYGTYWHMISSTFCEMPS